MDTRPIKEWYIPEGEVMQVTDESGQVLWSAGYKIMFNFGTITPIKAPFAYYEYVATISAPTFDFSLCNTLLVNGVPYEMVYRHSDDQYNIAHVFDMIPNQFGVSEEYPYRVIFRCIKSEDKWEACFSSYSPGTYEVSIGRLW